MSASARRGFSLRLFLPDGIPDGLKIVEKSNWIGRGVVCPRSRFKDAKTRPEFDRTGVYLLAGPSEEGDLLTVYIGEGDPALPRLERHFAEKDFWTYLILFVSKDENLNKAHVQYLEARLVERAKAANRCRLENGNVPQLPSLSEADIAEMDGFLDEMLLIFPVLGLSVFEQPQPTKTAARRYYLRARGIEAQGYEDPSGFVSLAGSRVARYSAPPAQTYLVKSADTVHLDGHTPRNGSHHAMLRSGGTDLLARALLPMLRNEHRAGRHSRRVRTARPVPTLRKTNLWSSLT